MSRTDLNNEDGVYYVDHLHDLVMDKVKPHQVVLRTDDEIFTDVPVKAWWVRSKSGTSTRNFFFDVPDEVWRRIQSSYITRLYREIYGLDVTANLPKAFREVEDAERWRRNSECSYTDCEVDVIENDWSTLRKAIEVTAARGRDVYDGPRILLIDPHERGNGRARLRQGRLEIYMRPVTVRRIIMEWKQAAEKGIPLPEAW